MKIYQLVAYGNLALRGDRYKVSSQKVYRTEEAAKAAIPEFFRLVTTAKNDADTMAMDPEQTQIAIAALELMNNKKEEKDGT